MHDRPSNQPPIEYIGQDQFIQEQLMEQYTAERAGTNVRSSEDLHTFYNAGIHSAKPSNMYRFGKALVNAFNPIMVWHGLNGKWKEKMEEDPNPEKEMLEQRRAKAEAAYAELKRVGYPGTQSMSTVDISSTRLEHDRAFISSRDSGIDVDSYRSSSERKRDGLVFDANNIVMVQQSSSGIEKSASPGPDKYTYPESTLHLREGSFTSLKKVKSHLQLPTPRRQSASPALIPSSEVDHAQIVAETGTIKKQLSRKDLHKQQKLTKKVSDLETKLEKARRELYQSMDDIPPVPPLPSTRILRPFIPGALPSERLLSGHLVESTSSLAKPATSTMGCAVGSAERDTVLTESRRQLAETPTVKKAQKLIKSAPRAVSTSTNKRKSGNPEDALRQTAVNEEEESISLRETSSADENRRSLPAKFNEVDLHESLRLIKGAQDYTVLHDITNSSTADDSTTKEISVRGRSGFDPAQVDETKMLAMRLHPDSNVPFGKLSDDISNLRKEFPDITNDQIVEYISVIFNGETWHPMRTSSKHILPTEGPPLSNSCDVYRERPHSTPTVSPSRAILWSPRSLSPPLSPDVLRNIETDLHNPWGLTDHDVIRISPEKNKNVPPVPKVPKAREDRKAKVLEEVTEKEEWLWDDDVF